jgi:hypothetical protein
MIAFGDDPGTPCVSLSNYSLLAKAFYKLGREDSNLRMAAPKAAALPLGYAPIAAI